MKRLSNMAIWLLVSQMAAVVGCGSADRASVQGRVTFEGQPVDLGNIVFVPEAGEGIKMAAPIEDGKYQIETKRGVQPGTYLVEISWSKKTGRQVPSADPGIMMDEMQEALPAQYNTETTLRRELQRGENVHDFELPTP